MSITKRHSISRRTFMKKTSGAAAGAAFAASIKPVFAASAERTSRGRGWYGNIYRQLHLDAHHGGFKEIYKDFNAEAAARMCKDAGFQMVSYMAQDGPSYYPTKIGKVHEGLDRDFVGEFTRALKKRGIRCIVYFGMGQKCNNSPYADEVVIPQMKEIVLFYDVDGFFPDGILQPYLSNTCRCSYCRELFAKEVGGEIPQTDNDPKAFAYRKWANRHMEAHMEKVHRSLSEIKPEIAILNNHLWLTRYPVTPPRYVQHICWDTPVQKEGLHAWNFSFEARYLASLPDILPDVTWSCMNVSSLHWMDYELRETEAFMHECAIMLAACGRTYLSNNPYPSGNLPPTLIEAFSEVNRRTRDLEPFLKDCRPVKDVAVLHAADSVWSKAPMKPHVTWTPSPTYQSVAGAHKALVEGHVQIGILNSEVFVNTLNEYRALVLPDQRILNERECEEIRRFVRNGGSLIATCETATRDTENNRLNNFSIADVLGVEYLGSSDTANCYLRVRSKNEQYGIPAYDIPVVGRYARIKTTTAKTLLELVPPYEGIKDGTPPPAELSEGPGVTVNSYGKGKALYCSAGLFSAYYRQDTPLLRKLALWMLGQVYPQESRLIVLEDTPITVEVFYNQRGNELFIHLVNYCCDKREIGMPHAQDFHAVHGIKVEARIEKKPYSVKLVPGGADIAFDYTNGVLQFNAEPLNIHDVYQVAF